MTSEVSFSTAEVNALWIPLSKINSKWSYQSLHWERTDIFLYHMPFLIISPVYPDSWYLERLLMAFKSIAPFIFCFQCQKSQEDHIHLALFSLKPNMSWPRPQPLLLKPIITSFNSSTEQCLSLKINVLST